MTGYLGKIFVQEYEATAKRKREETRERTEGVGSEFMQKLGHVQRIELLHGLNDMAADLKSFLVTLLPFSSRILFYSISISNPSPLSQSAPNAPVCAADIVGLCTLHVL